MGTSRGWSLVIPEADLLWGLTALCVLPSLLIYSGLLLFLMNHSELSQGLSQHISTPSSLVGGFEVISWTLFSG